METELPFVIQDNVRQYTFRACWHYLQRTGKKRYGNSFKLYAEDKEIIYKLLVYAIRDKENCKAMDVDLNKGILLNGPVGCGKTTLMNLIRTFHYPHFNYQVISTRDIAAEYNKEGVNVIHRYGRTQKIYCFDDLGTESVVKHFGNDCNTMAEILMHRYDLHVNYGIVTHATTNLNAQELENHYGNRVRSRLRSMFNLISFPDAVPDKRK